MSASDAQAAEVIAGDWPGSHNKFNRVVMAIVSREILSGTAVSVIDQAMLSGLNLLIGLAIIRLGAKADYGIYVQLFTLMLLAQGVQDALINAPMVAMAPKGRQRRLRAICAHLFRVQFCMALALGGVALLGLLAAAGPLDLEGLRHSVAVPFALAVIGQAAREYARDYSFLDLRPERVLLVDALYVGIVLAGLVTGAALGRLHVEWVFAAVAVGGMVSGWWGLARSGLRPLHNHGRGWRILKEAWSLSRWALPSVVIWWVSNYAFIYIVAGLIGVLAAADVGAARLLLMPVGLCSVAWGNIFLPRASRWIGQRAYGLVQRVAGWSCLGLAGLIGVYLAALLLAYPWLERWVLGDEYSGLQPLAVAWAAYFAAAAFRNSGSQAMSAGARYRDMFWYTLLGMVITVPLLVWMTMQVGVTGAVWAQALVEVVMGLVIWLHGWPRVRRMDAQPADDG